MDIGNDLELMQQLALSKQSTTNHPTVEKASDSGVQIESHELASSHNSEAEVSDEESRVVNTVKTYSRDHATIQKCTLLQEFNHEHANVEVPTTFGLKKPKTKRDMQKD